MNAFLHALTNTAWQALAIYSVRYCWYRLTLAAHNQQERT